MIAELYQRLELDHGRPPFSQDFQAVNDKILRCGSRSEIEAEINKWLGTSQPCLFGKIAARQGHLRYCILTQEDLIKSDPEIRETIQVARTAWLNAAFDGLASGFVVVAASAPLSQARPNPTLQQLACELCSLHLFEQPPVQPDTVRTDAIFLEKAGRQRRTWKWQVGINFFGAQGEGRWWQDHRIPGGIALSMNSVGHMAKAGAMNKAMKAVDSMLEVEREDWGNDTVATLEKALTLAMRTIRVASDGARPGTRLFSQAEKLPALACPYTLAPDIRESNYCEYFGAYHTDWTIPTPYFRDDFERPGDVPTFDDLDFSYLFDKSLAEYIPLAKGQRIRAGKRGEDVDELLLKREIATATEVQVDDEPLLLAALAARR